MSKKTTEQDQELADRIAAIISWAEDANPAEKESRDRQALLEIRDLLTEFDSEIIERNKA